MPGIGKKILSFSFAAMLSKAQVKDIRSLTQYKYRKAQGAFIVEGDKLAREWLASGASVKMIIGTKSWLAAQPELLRHQPAATVIEVKDEELTRISTLQSPNSVLLVVGLPEEHKTLPENGWCLALDRLQDPGNMGTIIRIADWYGIRHIVASPDAVDFYSPKVVQAAMGGHLRVSLHTAPLLDFLSRTKLPVLAATLDGQNIYHVAKPEAAILMIGNESKGLDPELLALANTRLTIPRIGGAESLNAAVATGIICALMIPQ